jgi:acyl carrier protein
MAAMPDAERLDRVRALVLQHARLAVDPSSVTHTSDLYDAGLTSLTTVHLMLALEDAFEVEFPDRLLARRTFGSVLAIAEAIEEIQG